MNLATLPKDFFQVPDPANLSLSKTADDINLVLAGPGTAKGYRLLVRIDNNACHGKLKAVAVIDINGIPNSVADDCGFLPYTDKANSKARLSFEASHPNNFATLQHHVYKGLGIEIPQAEIPSPNEMVIGNTSGFTLSAGTFTKDVPLTDMLGACNKAAFAETLGVYALATDGTYRLTGYDAQHTLANPLTAGFALELV